MPRRRDSAVVGMSDLSVPALADDVDTLTAALKYAAAGWYVLPVRDGTKDAGSVVGKRWQDKSSREPEQIVAWFAGTDHGIALHVGRSGAVVFDVDNPDALPDVLRRHLADAPYQSTRPDQPGRGHYIFRQPPGRMIGNGAGRLGGAWGEVRGLNGVIIAAPSAHADGGQYRWERR
jgi:Bifunctional DNA primase/polymerase, N-terminal